MAWTPLPPLGVNRVAAPFTHPPCTEKCELVCGFTRLLLGPCQNEDTLGTSERSPNAGFAFQMENDSQSVAPIAREAVRLQCPRVTCLSAFLQRAHCGLSSTVWCLASVARVDRYIPSFSFGFSDILPTPFLPF